MHIRQDTLRFVALIPHRDYRRLLREYRRRLFAAGLPGAYSFPEAAPLVVTERPWTWEELKAAAASLRALTGEAGFRTGAGKCVACPGGPLFWGLSLDAPWPDAPPFPLPAGSRLIPGPALCAALLDPKDERRPIPDAPSPAFSFRAAALANLIWEPLGEGAGPYSFAWRIGRPCWLPKLISNRDYTITYTKP